VGDTYDICKKMQVYYCTRNYNKKILITKFKTIINGLKSLKFNLSRYFNYRVRWSYDYKRR